MKNKMGTVIRFFVIFMVFLSLTGGLTQRVQAAGCTWTGNLSNNWNDVGNWDGCLDVGDNPVIPGLAHDVTIPAGRTHYPVLNQYSLDQNIELNSLTIAAGGQLTVDLDSTVRIYTLGTFVNEGTITVTGGGGHVFNIEAEFNNSGVVTIGSGATLKLYQGGSHTGSFTGRGAQLTFMEPTLGVNGNTFETGSSIDVRVLMVRENNDVDIRDGFYCEDDIYVWLGSTVDLSAAQIDKLGSVNLRGGVLITNAIAIPEGETFAGVGTVETDLTNSGTIRPGQSPGTITVDGDYTQESTGSLRMELYGTTPDEEYDQLIVTGSATLGGLLEVTLFYEFTPTVGQSFTLMTYASRSGVFDEVSLPDVAANQEWKLDYGETALVLSLEEKDEMYFFLPLFMR